MAMRTEPLPPADFCAAVTSWLAAPTLHLSADLTAAVATLSLVPQSLDAPGFERQLMRLASNETPGADPEHGLGARALLDLWQASQDGSLHAAASY
jgi:hypothetical protein